MTSTANETSLSIRAALAVLDAEGFGENAMLAIIGQLKAAGLIKQTAFQGPAVMLSDLNAAMKGL